MPILAIAPARRTARRLAYAAVAVLATTAAACGGSDKSTGPKSSINGTYALRTVEGDALPATGELNGQVVTISAGSLTISNENSFQLRYTINNQQQSDQGTITRNGSSIAFNSTQFSDFTGTVSNNNGTVTVNYDLTDDNDVVAMAFSK